MSQQNPLDYDPGLQPPLPRRRTAGMWLSLIMVWITGLCVWVLYLALLAVLIFRLLG
jgi:hypothetical protein